jgi:hypothetical protein
MLENQLCALWALCFVGPRAYALGHEQPAISTEEERLFVKVDSGRGLG